MLQRASSRVLENVTAEDVEAIPGMWLPLKGKRTKQSSTCYGGVSSRAVDGDASSNYGKSSCTHTCYNRGHAWWEVDLGQTYMIETVRVTNRGDCCGARLRKFSIIADGTQCSQDLSTPQGGASEFQCSKPGRVLQLKSQITDPLTLCEVEVKADLPGPPGRKPRRSWSYYWSEIFQLACTVQSCGAACRG